MAGKRAHTKAWKGQLGTDRSYTRRKAVADSRNDAGTKRQRTLLGSHSTWKAARSSLGMHNHDQGLQPGCVPCGLDYGTLQIRKNKNGFGVYRREVV